MSRTDTIGLRGFVDRLTLRSALNQEEQDAILALPARLVEIRAKQDFAHVNEPTTSSRLIVSGMAAGFAQTSDGARQITAFHLPGDMADLHSVVRPISLGGLNALCDMTILQVPHQAIRALAARHPAIAEAFWRDCMVDAAVLMQWVVNVGRRDAQTRLAHLFCEMASRFGDDRAAASRYKFPVTQEQLGDASALTSVHVNRSLKALREEGLVTHRGGTVDITDWARLARLGEFDASYLVSDTARDRQQRLPAEA